MISIKTQTSTVAGLGSRPPLSRPGLAPRDLSAFPAETGCFDFLSPLCRAGFLGSHDSHKAGRFVSGGFRLQGCTAYSATSLFLRSGRIDADPRVDKSWTPNAACLTFSSSWTKATWDRENHFFAVAATWQKPRIANIQAPLARSTSRQAFHMPGERSDDRALLSPSACVGGLGLSRDVSVKTSMGALSKARHQAMSATNSTLTKLTASSRSPSISHS